MRRLLIIGAGGHGMVIADAADQMEQWSSIVFLDDAYPNVTTKAEWQVIGDSGRLQDFSSNSDAAIAAIGNCAARLDKLVAIRRAGIRLATVIHPTAVVSRFATIGDGTALLANTTVNASANIGLGCIVNTGAVVEHDCRLADGVHVASGATLAGSVEVGERSWIGAGATVCEQISIGADVVVGAGAVVIRNVPDRATVVGVPARAIR